MRTSIAMLLCLVEVAWCDSIGKRQALQPFNDLIGEWKGTGVPEGSRQEQQQGFWIETMSWEWRFKGDDAWLAVEIDNGKHFHSGELRFVPAANQFQLALRDKDGKQLVFRGKLEKRVLTLVRDTPTQTERLTFRLLHANRFTYSLSVRQQSRNLYLPVYQVGVTKQNVPFAQGSGQPECIVSGGLGTMAVMYQGRTYYVCCSGCRDEFNADPEKYINEFNTRKKAK